MHILNHDFNSHNPTNMFKVIKKVLLSALSVLGLTTIVWSTLLINPSLSYANETEFDFIIVYHNDDLANGTEEVVLEAIEILKKSELYHDKISLDLCLNDDQLYPKIHPLMRGDGPPLAYALFDKTIIFNCEPDFENNIVTSQWPVNNHELRTFKLSYLLAHEFIHNLQFDESFRRVFKLTKGVNIHWKLEGYADYVAREYANDGLLKSRIQKFLEQDKLKSGAFPVFELADGTMQIFSYFKYSLIVQYMMEVKNLNYVQMCEHEASQDELYKEMLDWANL